MKPGYVSVIILNWNSRQFIHTCINSVLKQTYTDVEIIVVDNGSTDGSLEDIQHQFSDKLKIIRNDHNLGFAQGVNIGIKEASGEFVALLNSDAVAEPQWLEEMVKGLSSSEAVGMAACKIYLANQEDTLDNVGLVLSRDGQNRCRGRLQKDSEKYSAKEAALCPSGCAGLYRRKMLDLIGFFDEKFFSYGEDMELGLRAQYFGYSCLYIPTAVVHHELSGSTGAYSTQKAYFVERNRMWIVLKCFPLKSVFAAIGYSILRYYYHLAGLWTKKGPSYQYGKSHSPLLLPLIVLKAYGSTLIHLPYLIAQRRKISPQINSEIFEQLLDQHGISVKDASLGEVL